MGWDAIHLGRFFVQSGCYGSCELSAESANIVLNDLKLRRQPGCTNTISTFPGSMEIQLEELCSPEPRTHNPGFIGDGGTCQPQDCGRTEAWIRQLQDARGYGLGDEFATVMGSMKILLAVPDPVRTVYASGVKFCRLRSIEQADIVRLEGWLAHVSLILPPKRDP